MFFRKVKEDQKPVYDQQYAESKIRILVDCGKYTEARFWEIRFNLTHGYNIDIVGDRWNKTTKGKRAK